MKYIIPVLCICVAAIALTIATIGLTVAAVSVGAARIAIVATPTVIIGTVISGTSAAFAALFFKRRLCKIAFFVDIAAVAVSVAAIIVLSLA